MVIAFGTAFYGKVKTLNKQWIETKFFYIFIPLFPLQSMLVTHSRYGHREGIEIPLNKTSVIALYGRLISLILVISSCFYYYADVYGGFYTVYYFPFKQIIFTSLNIYFCFFFGKSTKIENEQRNKLGKAIGLYAMPDWFYGNKVSSILDDLNRRYILYFESDWKQDLMGNKPIQENKLPMLYALALFTYMYYGNEEDLPYYNKAYEIFN